MFFSLYWTFGEEKKKILNIKMPKCKCSKRSPVRRNRSRSASMSNVTSLRDYYAKHFVNSESDNSQMKDDLLNLFLAEKEEKCDDLMGNLFEEHQKLRHSDKLTSIRREMEELIVAQKEYQALIKEYEKKIRVAHKKYNQLSAQIRQLESDIIKPIVFERRDRSNEYIKRYNDKCKYVMQLYNKLN